MLYINKKEGIVEIGETSKLDLYYRDGMSYETFDDTDENRQKLINLYYSKINTVEINKIKRAIERLNHKRLYAEYSKDINEINIAISKQYDKLFTLRGGGKTW